MMIRTPIDTAIRFKNGGPATMPTSASAFEGYSVPIANASSSVLRPSKAARPLHRLEAISRIVNHVMASWHSPLALAEQRGWQRISYDHPAILTLLDDRTSLPIGVHKVVSGRDISPSGFSFTHLDPLACRRAIVTFAFEPEETEAIELRLTWCRFTRAGIYQSGGKFLNPTASPLPAELVLDHLPYA
jgi:hypothetical protein